MSIILLSTVLFLYDIDKWKKNFFVHRNNLIIFFNKGRFQTKVCRDLNFNHHGTFTLFRVTGRIFKLYNKDKLNLENYCLQQTTKP